MDFETILNRLINLSKKNNGCVNAEDIAKYADDTSPLYDQLEKALSEQDIMIMYMDDDITEQVEDFEQIEKDFSSSSSIQQYLHEISRFPLLTFEEEIDCCEKVKKLLKVNAKLEANPEYKCHHMKQIIEEGEMAKEKMINCNLKLVVAVAKKFYGNASVSLMDLIQEGNMGLIKAVDKYDHTKGFRFSTYATWWIRQAITRALADQSRTIRIPVHISETKNKINRTKRELVQTLGREPTYKEIAKALNYSEDRVQEIENYGQDTVSLEIKVGDDQDATLSDFIADTEQLTPLQYTMKIKLSEELKLLLSSLSEKEAHILIARFGLDGDTPKTLEEVSKDYDITRERVRQIEAKALRKIKPYARRKGLDSFIKKD